MGRWEPADVVLQRRHKYRCPETGKHISQYHLCHKSKVPQFLLDNPYIENGYRVYFPIPLCLYSVVRLHNESGNIWTHFLSFFLFLGLAYHTFVNFLPQYEGLTWLDYVLWGNFFVSAMFCFLASTFYHTFMCHSFKTCLCFAYLDFSGITLLICCSWMMLANHLMHCFPAQKWFYLITIGSFTLAKVALPRLGTMSQAARVISFGSMALFGIIPIIHWSLLLGIFHEGVKTMTWRYIVDWFVYGAGLAFYVLRIPEKWCPGRFDYFFHSHQLWHIFVTLGTVMFYHINLVLFDLVHRDTCAALLSL